MKKTKHTKNQMTDRQYLFGSKATNKKKKNNIKLNKEELSNQINKQVVAYLNSGGKIQRCTPCTYSENEKEVIGPSHRSAMEGLKW